MTKFKKTLLIDDDSITNYINAFALKNAKLSMEVKVTMNGAEAIDYLKNDCNRENIYPDLIIVDINMSVMDGFEFIHEYKILQLKEAPIIILLSTSYNPEDIQRAADLGIKVFNKPLKVAMIADLPFGIH